MSALFTAERRDEVLKNLQTFLQADDQIAGAVLVGSGVRGFQDNYSGIDLLVAVKNGTIFPSVYAKWKDRLLTLFPIVYHFESVNDPETGICSLMFDNYLEVNLNFMPLRCLVAARKPWCVLFDQTELQEVEPTLQNSYRETIVEAPTRAYLDLMSMIWQPVIKCVTALNRDETWRALHMLERVRNQTIELAAMNYDVDTRNYTEVDKLPEMLLVALRHTLPTSISNVAIRRALNTTVTIFFQQAEKLEETIEPRLAQDLKQRILPYIEAYS